MRMRNIATFIVSVVMLLTHVCGDQQDNYVDPTDLINFDPVAVRMRKNEDAPVKQEKLLSPLDPIVTKDSDKAADVESSTNKLKQSVDMHEHKECSKINSSLASFTSLFRQHVNKLVHLLESEIDRTSNPVEINLHLRASYHDLSKLRSFGQSDKSEIHDVHETLNYMMLSASRIQGSDSNIYWLEKKIGMSSTVLVQILSITLSLMLSLIILSRMNISWRLIRLGIILTYIVSVVLAWIELYQKEVADQEKILMNKLSDHCPKMEDLSFFGRLSSYFFSTFTFDNERCREFYQAMFVNPLVKVSPIEAASIAIVKSFVAPLGIIGKGIKEFIIGLLYDLPFQYQFYILSGFPVFILLLLFFCFRYQVRLFGVFALGPPDNRHYIQGEGNINQQGNAVGYRAPEPRFIQQGSPEGQRLAIDGHQDIGSNAQPAEQNSRASGCLHGLHNRKLNKNLNPHDSTQNVNDSGETNKNTKTGSSSIKQADDSVQGTAVQTVNRNAGVATSEVGRKLKGSNEKSEDKNVDDLVGKAKDLTISGNGKVKDLSSSDSEKVQDLTVSESEKKKIASPKPKHVKAENESPCTDPFPKDDDSGGQESRTSE